MLLLLDDVLEQTVTRVASDRHVAVLFEFSVVALGLLRNAISEEPAREALVLVLNREHFVETSEAVELMNTALLDFPGKLFATHLVPE